MTESPTFQIKKTNNEYTVWVPNFGIIKSGISRETALNDAEALVNETIDAYKKANIPLPVSLDTAADISIISPLVKANMISFGLKLILVSIMLALIVLLASRVLPIRGLSDFAAYSRLASPQRIEKLKTNAQTIGKVSRPILRELGLGCPCEYRK
ncbi:MAG: hypothetical protein CMF69_12330 [Magnetovibrio sp.]|nr:hypothetical protein [Magnetovibrio sp.]|tara:strand:+ start:196 stop:660 length:465 start_codon:yes stop_codon:yes gene_type:complete